MRWKQGRRSSNVEDRRGGVAKRGLQLGGGATIAIVIISFLMGQNPLKMLEMLGTFEAQPTQTQEPQAYSEEADFISVVLADTEDVWSTIFGQHGARYRVPKLVLYSNQTDSACGLGSAATGPFYCPADEKVYLDLSFFNELKRLGGPGDFAQAYVVGHEIGHHVQNITGTSSEVSALQRRSSQREANALSVNLELQADCYAGVWAHHAHQQRNILEEGDLEEGLAAAAAIGDDRLQEMAGQVINPDAFTHGSSQQRMKWFTTGLKTGDIENCNTFN